MFVVDILTSISSGNDIKNALKSLPIFHSHESVNIMNKTLSSGCLTIFIQFISNRGKKCEIRKYYSQLFLFRRCLLFYVSWIKLSFQFQSDTYTFVFQETLRIWRSLWRRLDWRWTLLYRRSRQGKQLGNTWPWKWVELSHLWFLENQISYRFLVILMINLMWMLCIIWMLVDRRIQMAQQRSEFWECCKFCYVSKSRGDQKK